MKKALVTVLIGDRYIREWETWFRPSWEPYAKRHGYDIVAITDYIDHSPRAIERKPHWQKLLVFEYPALAEYDHLVWVDADILINFHTAPCIVEQHSSPLIGLVSDKQTLFGNPERQHNVVQRAAPFGGRLGSCQEQYRATGLPDDLDDYSNTGVIVMHRSHADVLRYVYDTYEETPYSAKEETPLSYHLYRHGLVKPLDPRFNRPWLWTLMEHYPWLAHARMRRHPVGHASAALAVNAAWHNGWFMHFTGDTLSDGEETIVLRNDVALVMQHVKDIMEIRVA